MTSAIHILNGDALEHRLRNTLTTETIIMREMLMEGPLVLSSQESFINARQRYFQSEWSVKPQDYLTKSGSELSKIHLIPSNSLIYLWFEDDVFCQINLWFCFYTLTSINKTKEIYWVRSDRKHPFSFGESSDVELLDLLEHAQSVHEEDCAHFTKLFKAYASKDFNVMKSLSGELSENYYETVKAAIQAEEIRHKNLERSPQNILSTYKDEYPDATFKDAFAHLLAEAPVYGYGDLQVLKMWEAISDNSENS